METRAEDGRYYLDEEVQSNLWGMETRRFGVTLRRWTVFNRIYEEWKHELRLRRHVSSWPVQSNLWGMETAMMTHPKQIRVEFNRIYEEWKQTSGGTLCFFNNCSIESMRNGNSNKIARLTSAPRSSIESMRNGNEVRLGKAPSKRTKFNRIYEEWKLNSIRRSPEQFPGSIESMRNGNLRHPHNGAWNFSCSIESMRNGNLDLYPFSLRWPFQVQSNLWGMETARDIKY